ncbi:MAG: gliding motility-associated C-terminal domain-containing protein [Bacteroidales bacterium]|nr:gliding motility-associated C-terminal domain-containing protein [Candidatus Colimorpha onthohippi]
MSVIGIAKRVCVIRVAKAFRLLFATLLLSITFPLRSQQPTTQGVDFWLTYLFNYDATADLKLIVTAKRACTGVAVNQASGWAQTFTVQPGQITYVDIPSSFAYTSSYGGATPTGIHVTTTDTVSLYASNYYEASFDVTNILPTATLRDEYVVQTYAAKNAGAYSEFSIVATQDNTKIDITIPSTGRTLNGLSGRTYTQTLNAGEVHQMVSYYGDDLSGTYIKSRDCKPIAVYAGNIAAQVPYSSCCGDHLVEQLMPTNYHGKKFIITSSLLRTNDRVKITASEDDCELWVNGVYSMRLSAYQSVEYELRANEVACLETTKPAQVFLYFTGATYGSMEELGDPSMVMISPVEQQIGKVTFGTFSTPITNRHFVNVITQTKDVPNMVLDNANISSRFTRLPYDTTYSYARMEINYGSHTLECEDGAFVAHVYGIGKYESYSYSVGSSAADLATYISINGSERVLDDDAAFATCKGSQIRLDAKCNYPLASAVWQFGDGSSATGLSVNHSYNTVGYHDAKVITTLKKERCGLLGYDTASVKIFVSQSSNVQVDGELCEGGSYIWNDSRYNAPGTYTFSTTNQYGCDSSVTLTLVQKTAVTTNVGLSCIENQLPYVYKNYIFSNATDTTLIYKSRDGCDSLVKVSLKVWLNQQSQIDSSVCENSLPLEWNEVWFAWPQQYPRTDFDIKHTKILFGVHGEDSTVDMVLRIMRNSEGRVNKSITENELPYRYEGLVFYGEQSDTLLKRSNVKGCDSLIHFSLNVLYNSRTVRDTTICEGALPLTWCGFQFKASSTTPEGTYMLTHEHTYTASDGTDSLVIYRVKVNRNSLVEYHKEQIERYLPYQFAGRLWRTDQEPTIIKMTNHIGCDSLITFSLKVWHNVSVAVDSTVCENQMPFIWNQMPFVQPSPRPTGAYTLNQSKVLIGCHGEDSTVNMTLHVNRNSYSEHRDTVVENALPVWYAGVRFTDAQSDTTLVRVNKAGCDSLIKYSLYVRYNKNVVHDSVVCENGLPVVWNGVRFVSPTPLPSGTFSISHVTKLRASDGADSNITMRLKVYRNSAVTYHKEVIENNLPYRFAGIVWTTDHTDTNLLRVNSVGCDSLITFSLKVWRNQEVAVDSEICENQLPLVWNNIRYVFPQPRPSSSFSLTGSKVLRGVHGEDSTVNMTVYVKRNSRYQQSDTVVENRLPVNFSGVRFVDSQPETTLVRVNAAGCDSLITYRLKVWKNRETLLEQTVCENALPLTWNSLSFTFPAHTPDGDFDVQHSKKFRGVHGEDSVVKMTLHVRRNSYVALHEEVVQNQLPYSYWGVTFDTDHDDTLLVRSNKAGCDSLITFSLKVWRNQEVAVDSEICENQLPLVWNNVRYVFPQPRPSSSFSLTGSKVLHGVHGEDSTVNMTVYVKRNSRYQQSDTVVENQLPVIFAGVRFVDSQPETTLVRVNAAGCDSLITYRLKVWKNRETLLEQTVCENALPVTWNTLSFTFPEPVPDGDFDVQHSKMFSGIHGEDSVVKMTLHVRRNSYDTLHEQVLQNQLPHSYWGVTFDMDQADTLLLRSNKAGCDSLITYALKVWWNRDTLLLQTVCENQLPVVWNGVTFNQGYPWPDSKFVIRRSKMLTASHGEDSLVHMEVYVNRNTYYSQHDTLVENSLPACIAGYCFYESHQDTTLVRVNQDGCDSLINYSLWVYHNCRTSLDSMVCENNLPIEWNGVQFGFPEPRETGVFDVCHDKMFEGAHGEDSLVSMRVHVLRNSYYQQRDTVVQNALPHRFSDWNFDTDVVDSLLVRPNSVGCDSLITYSLKVWWNRVSTIDHVLCENQMPWEWNGVLFELPDTLNQSPVYLLDTVLLVASHGEDSTVGMRVIVHLNTYYQQHDTVVQNRLPVFFAGVVFRDTQHDTVLVRRNRMGCDSLIDYSLHVWHNKQIRYDTMVCRNFLPLTWRDSLFTDRALKRAILPACHGEDSIIDLNLSVGEVYDILIDTTICSNVSFNVGGKEYRQRGNYEVMLRTQESCDSLIRLVLAVNQTFYGLTQDTICEGEVLRFMDRYYSKTGSYSLRHRTREGCDSILTLDLTVNPVYYDTEHVVRCYGERYRWEDSVEYGDSFVGGSVLYQTVDGCDSVRTLWLQIDRPVLAVADASPRVVSFDNATPLIKDRTVNSVESFWFVDGHQVAQGAAAYYQYPIDRDSVVVTLVTQSALGCVDTASVTLLRDMGQIWAPNIFTPELPSNNKFRFLVRDIGTFECRIYNRMGLLVYQSSVADEAWDGTHKGVPCPQGSYVYIVNYTSRWQPKERLTLKGSVLLVR